MLSVRKTPLSFNDFFFHFLKNSQLPNFFQLLSLATMFQKMTAIQGRTNLSPIGERYAMVLQRRLISELGYKTGMLYYQQFEQGLDVVREFAALLAKVFLPLLG